MFKFINLNYRNCNCYNFNSCFIIFLLRMGLLGKTLKGRTAREGGLPPKKNIKVRQIAKTQEEFDNLKKLAKMKKDILRSKIEH